MVLQHVLLHTLLALFLSAPTWAQSKGHETIKPSDLIYSADISELISSKDFKQRSIHLKKKVRIAFAGKFLEAEEAFIDMGNKKITASGHVRLRSLTTHAEAERIEIDLATEGIVLTQGFVQAGNVVFEGKRIEKIGENQYLATDAKYTACTTCPPAWSFSGKEIDAELGGYAKIKTPIIRIVGVPVLILPGIVVPLKSSRQSGFLVPEYDISSGGGFALSESYFWAIDPSRDLTVTATSYELRGIKAHSEYRYVLSESSSGVLSGAFLRDRAFENPTSGSDGLWRWYLNYHHHFKLPGDYIQRTHLTQFSDLYYIRDFPRELGGHGDPAVENHISLTKNTHAQHMSLVASLHQNLLKENPLSRNTDAVHRLPEITYRTSEIRLANSPLLLQMTGTFTQFARDNFSYDDLNSTSCEGGLSRCATVLDSGDVTRDGSFDPNTDFIRAGQRIDLRPSLSMPVNLFKVLEVMPRMTYRELQYRFQTTSTDPNFSSSAYQRYLDTDLFIRTRFSRIFGDLKDPQGDRFKHEFEPEIRYSTSPWIESSNHGFFGNFGAQPYSRTLDPITDEGVLGLDRLQFDYYDRVYDKEIIEYSLTNRITRKEWVSGSPDYRRMLTFRVSQNYDLREARTQRSQPWSQVYGLVDLRLPNFETFSTINYNIYAKDFTQASSRLRFFNDRGGFAQVSFAQILRVNQFNEINRNDQTRNIGLGIGFVSRYLNFAGEANYSAITSRILSWRYVAEIRPPGKCWIFKFTHDSPVAAQSSFHFNMSFDFGGDERPTL